VIAELDGPAVMLLFDLTDVVVVVVVSSPAPDDAVVDAAVDPDRGDVADGPVPGLGIGSDVQAPAVANMATTSASNTGTRQANRAGRAGSDRPPGACPPNPQASSRMNEVSTAKCGEAHRFGADRR